MIARRSGLVVALVLLAAPRGAQAVVYGTDDRTEILAHPSMAWQDRGRLSVLSMIDEGFAVCDGGATVQLATQILGESRDLCEGEPFYQQPRISYCSSTLIDDDVVVTAAHCIFDPMTGADLCPQRTFVAGAHFAADGTPPQPTVDDVYGCRQVLAHVPGVDVAIVQLERPVAEWLVPAPVSPVPVALGDAVGVLGFPDGIPMKVAEGCNVLTLTESLVGINCDIFRGNSGSGLFRADTHELLGVVAGAPSDYRNDGDCRVVNVLTEDGYIPGVESAPQLGVAYPVAITLAALCELGWPGPLCGTEAACGDGWCSGQETAERCAADCPASRCGDGVCAVLDELECVEDCGHITALCEEGGDSGDTGTDETGSDTTATTGGSTTDDATTTIGDPPGQDSGTTAADDATGGDAAASDDAGGCGCQTSGPGGSGAAWMVAGLVLLGSSRRRAGTTLRGIY